MTERLSKWALPRRPALYIFKNLWSHESQRNRLSARLDHRQLLPLSVNRFEVLWIVPYPVLYVIYCHHKVRTRRQPFDLKLPLLIGAHRPHTPRIIGPPCRVTGKNKHGRVANRKAFFIDDGTCDGTDSVCDDHL